LDFGVKRGFVTIEEHRAGKIAVLPAEKVADCERKQPQLAVAGVLLKL